MKEMKEVVGAFKRCGCDLVPAALSLARTYTHFSEMTMNRLPSAVLNIRNMPCVTLVEPHEIDKIQVLVDKFAASWLVSPKEIQEQNNDSADD